jgi:3-oxoacyl-[acyl-carrier protein] reductase
MRLAGKISIITGAGRGIGHATALKFAREGAIVIVCDMDRTGIDQTVAAVRDAGGKAHGFVVDVTDRLSI